MKRIMSALVAGGRERPDEGDGGERRASKGEALAGILRIGIGAQTQVGDTFALGCRGMLGTLAIFLQPAQEPIDAFKAVTACGQRGFPRFTLGQRILQRGGHRHFVDERHRHRWRGPVPETQVAPAAMTAERISLMRSDRVDGRLIYTEAFSVRL